jgi:AcrR family transcriptional regulator
MPRLSSEAQSARRERILDAAERCFVRTGFHAATMQHICEEADVSAGALYVYFASKEALILGLCDREMDKFFNNIEAIAKADDFLGALKSMAEHYCCEVPIEKVRLHIEIGAEAGRNPIIAKRLRDENAVIVAHFIELLEREREAGRIQPAYPIETVVRAMGLIGDGLFWHRSVDDAFDPRAVIPAVMTMISALIAPSNPSAEKIQA